MPLELRIPPVGESITEVQVGDWLKKEGDRIRKDENLVLIESEKATLDLPSPADGVLQRILHQRGATVRVGEVIAHIEAGAPASGPDPGTAPVTAASATPPATGGDTQTAPAPTPIVMPAAQRVLADAGIPATAVQGTGKGGRVTKEDAVRAVHAGQGSGEATSTQPPPSSPAPETPATSAGATPEPAAAPEDDVVPMSPLRRTVARRLVEAQATMAMLTTFNEIDMSAVMGLRKQFQETFTARHGIKLGIMSFFVKAVVEGLKTAPALNAEVRESSIVYHRSYDIGVAVGGGKGLVVPVLRRVDRLGFAEIEKAISDFGARAREGRLKPDELQGGTFTITNGGIYGSLLSTPIINPPQSGILGMHAIQERAVVIDGQVVARPMMYVALTYDHRIVDGREAVTFLKRVKDILETPARMLLEA